MKVVLASIIPLLASLLLPSEVRCRGRIREEDEYEVSHVRKRAMKFKEYFNKGNLQKTCSLCHKQYGIDEANCMTSKRKAKLKCMLKVKQNRAYFESMWPEAVSSSTGKQPKTTEEHFSSEFLKKTCQICADIGGVNLDDCIADKNQGRVNCRYTMDEMGKRFRNEWDLYPMHEYKIKHYSKRSIEIGEYFRGNNLQKACSICHTHYGIDKAKCIASKRMAKYKCMVKVKENQAFFESKWTESNSPAAGEVEVRHVKKRSIAVQDESKGENLEMFCSICHEYFGIDEASCIENTQKVMGKCQQKVEESFTFLDSKWTKSNSSAAGQPGTKKSIQQMCSICDQLFHFSSSNCVADKKGVRQKCQNWINAYENLRKEAERQQSEAPGSAESDSEAVKFSKAEN